MRSSRASTVATGKISWSELRGRAPAGDLSGVGLSTTTARLGTADGQGSRRRERRKKTTSPASVVWHACSARVFEAGGLGRARACLPCPWPIPSRLTGRAGGQAWLSMSPRPVQRIWLFGRALPLEHIAPRPCRTTYRGTEDVRWSELFGQSDPGAQGCHGRFSRDHTQRKRYGLEVENVNVGLSGPRSVSVQSACRESCDGRTELSYFFFFFSLFFPSPAPAVFPSISSAPCRPQRHAP